MIYYLWPITYILIDMLSKPEALLDFNLEIIPFILATEGAFNENDLFGFGINFFKKSIAWKLWDFMFVRVFSIFFTKNSLISLDIFLTEVMTFPLPWKISRWLNALFARQKLYCIPHFLLPLLLLLSLSSSKIFYIIANLNPFKWCQKILNDFHFIHYDICNFIRTLIIERRL